MVGALLLLQKTGGTDAPSEQQGGGEENGEGEGERVFVGLGFWLVVWGGCGLRKPVRDDLAGRGKGYAH